MLATKKAVASVFLGVTLMLAGGINPALADGALEERPSATAMFSDVLLRPVMALGVAIGAVTYVVSLPLSLAGGNAKEVGNSLVVVPAKATFVRCLGCTKKHEPTAEYYKD